MLVVLVVLLVLLALVAVGRLSPLTSPGGWVSFQRCGTGRQPAQDDDGRDDECDGHAREKEHGCSWPPWPRGH